MTFLKNLILAIFGFLAFVSVLLVFWRSFEPELTKLGCAVAITAACPDTPVEASELDIDDLIREVQVSLKQVQSANLGAKTPHMFFVDDLELELHFQVEKTADAELKLLVVPASSTLGHKSSESQKLSLKFSTIVDESIRAYLEEACKSTALFDERAISYCSGAVGGGSATESVSVETDKLNLDIQDLWEGYKFPTETMPDPGVTLPWQNETSTLCKEHGLCAATGVDAYDFKAADGSVTGLQLKLDYSDALANALQQEETLKGWTFSPSVDGTLRLELPSQ